MKPAFAEKWAWPSLSGESSDKLKRPLHGLNPPFPDFARSYCFYKLL